MRILHVIPYFYPAWRFGGPVRVAYDVSCKLVEQGHSVTVYTSDILDDNARIDSYYSNVKGVNVYYFKNINLNAAKRRIYITPSLLTATKHASRLFDIVHIHGNRTTQSPILHHYLRKTKVPYVIQAHGGLPILSDNKTKKIYDMLFGNRILRDAAFLIALTQRESVQYIQSGAPAKKVVIIPNGIDLSEYQNRPQKGSFKKFFRIASNKKIILYLGRLHQTKGIGLIIKAYAHLVNVMKYHEAILVIAGPDDGYLAEANALVSAFNLRRSVLFAGFIDDATKFAALNDADLFVTPSFYGFPMTFLEACAMGVPIVTSSIGDTLDWIDGCVGYTTSPSEADLAQALFNILSNDSLHQHFSNNCLQITKKFSIESITDKLTQVYQTAIEQAKYGLL